MNKEIITLIDYFKAFMSSIFKFRLPIDILSAIAGGVVGLILVELWDWLRRPKIREVGFEKVNVNFGVLYKLKFKIEGKQYPGICQLEIRWSNKSVKAKWDELPNPLQDDNIDSFRPELVPVTFYQPLFLKRKYSVPIIHKDDNERLSIFSGWWFGRDKYGPDPYVTKSTQIELVLSGNNLHWRKLYKIEDILKQAEETNNN